MPARPGVPHRGFQDHAFPLVHWLSGVEGRPSAYGDAPAAAFPANIQGVTQDHEGGDYWEAILKPTYQRWPGSL